MTDTSTSPVTGDPIFTMMDRAFATTTSIIESVSPEELTLSTPCPGWQVLDIIDHIIGALEMFAGALGVECDATSSQSSTCRVRQLTNAVSSGWAATGRLDTSIDLPFGTFPAPLALRINVLETFIHGLDIAAATDRVNRVDPGLCGDVQTMAEAAGFDRFRQPGMFGPAVPAHDDSPFAQLMGFVGRTL